MAATRCLSARKDGGLEVRVSLPAQAPVTGVSKETVRALTKS